MGTERLDKSAPKQNQDAVFQFLNEHRDIKSVVVMGGEPTVEPDFMKRVLEESRKLNIKVHIITNGTMIPTWLPDYKDVLSGVQVSLDGCKEVHDLSRKDASGRGSYDATMKGLRFLAENKMNAYTHGVIPLEGWEKSLSTMQDFLMSLPEGITHGYEIEDGKKYTDELRLKIAKEFYKVRRRLPLAARKRLHLLRGAQSGSISMCGAGVDSMTYDAVTGNFYACHSGLGVEWNQVGNINDKEIFDASRIEKLVPLYNLEKYWYEGVPRFWGEFLKRILPFSVCWYNNQLDRDDPFMISKYERYLGWMNRKLGLSQAKDSGYRSMV